MAYVSVADMVARLGGRVDPAAAPLIEDAINEACAAIDVHCGQSFATSTVATPRIYQPTCGDVAYVDPFWTTSGLIIETDVDDDGAYETPWAATGYETVQFGGDRAGMLNAPYDTIRALTGRFPTGGRRTRTLQVTAKWGWAAAPTPIAAATKIVAHDLWKRKDVAFGIATSGVAEFGGLRIGRDVLASVASTLAPFVRADRQFGIA